MLADSWYGESKVNFVAVLNELNLPSMLAIRSQQALWLPQDQAVSPAPWQPFERTLSKGTTEERYMAAVLEGKRHRKPYWLLTTDPKTLPPNATAFVMMVAPEGTLQALGDHYGLRTWIKYGLKQAKAALSWTHCRMTNYEPIEKWWELVTSTFLRVSLLADQFNEVCPLAHQEVTQHPWWDNQSGWKHRLNNRRFISQPLIGFNWLKRWLEVFSVPSLQSGCEPLRHKMKQCLCLLVPQLNRQSIFSSALSD